MQDIVFASNAFCASTFSTSYKSYQSQKEKAFVQSDYKNIPLAEALGTIPRNGLRFFFSRNVSHALIQNMIKVEKPGRLREEMS